jgi:hypothetical protein
MFDHKFTLSSTDGSATLEIKAGTEGVKSIVLYSGGRELPIAPQTLIDVAAPALVAWSAKQ